MANFTNATNARQEAHRREAGSGMPGAIPTPTLTWDTTKVNQNGTGLSQLDTNRTTIKGMMDALLGLANYPPTCKGSSDSTAAAMDGTNRWSTNAKLVWAAAGTAHSWIVHEFPQIKRSTGEKLQVCFDLGVSSAGGTQWTVVASPKAGFTGGSTTARPTATDEAVSNSLGNAGLVASNVAQKWHLIASTDGKVFHILFCNGNKVPGWLLIAAPTATIDVEPSSPGWDYPWLVVTESGVGTSTNISPANEVAYGTQHLSRHAATALNCSFQWEGGSSLLASGGPGDANNGITAQSPMLAHGIWSNISAGLGRLGYIPDLFFVGADLYAAVGDTLGVDNSHRRWAFFGCIAIPWTNDATVPSGS